jgi:tetratricopeptide (TPR) repeat protein
LAIRSGFAGSFSHSAFDAALNEYKISLRVANDRAASLATLAQIHENDEEFERAEDLYRLAIGVEPNFAGPRANLASLLEQRADQIRSQLIQKSRAADVLRMGERIDKLLAEVHRLRTDEHHILRREVSRTSEATGMHRLYWRFGLSSYLLKQYQQAEKFLLKAYQARPATVDYCLALATFYLQQSRLDESLRYAEALIELAPDNQSYRKLRDEILAARSR